MHGRGEQQHYSKGDTDRDGKVTARFGAAQTGTANVDGRWFFRIEATNMLKRNEDTPGPNPIRTHLRKTGKMEAMRIPEDRRSGAWG